MYRVFSIRVPVARFEHLVAMVVTLVVLWSTPTVVLLAAPYSGDADEPISEKVERARHQFEAGHYQDVVALLKPAVAREPTSAAAYFWLGRAYFELHDYDRAIDTVRRSIELDPSRSDSHWWLGRAYGNQADRDRSFMAARRARQEFETAVQLDPSNVAARRDLMEFYLDAPRILGGGNDKALRQVDAIAAIEAIAGRLARAAYWALRRDEPKARAEYGAVLGMHPRTIDAYLEAAEFYEKHPDVDALKAVLEAAAKIDGSDPRLLYYRGVADVQSGLESEEAERSLKAYLNVAERSEWPSPASTHRLLGRLYESLGRQRDAAIEYATSQRLETERAGKPDR